MERNNQRKVGMLVTSLVLALILAFFNQGPSLAASNSKAQLVHYFSEPTLNVKKGSGYSDGSILTEKDPHFGWELGRFSIEGYSRQTIDKNAKEIVPVFLKNYGDEVSLCFELLEDIDRLKDNKNLKIAEDTKGSNREFGVEKQNFEKGALIIKHIDHQNLESDPIIHTNFLASEVAKGEKTIVDIFEEGNYEVALNYKIKNTSGFGSGVVAYPSYTYYKKSFKFAVRNGNTMAFLFDLKSGGGELKNKDFTGHGFRIDLANSHFLDVDVRKEILTEKGDELVADVRFNRPAKDGDFFTEEGVYTITIRSRYTEGETIKRIYVGYNDILKSHVITGMLIPEIIQLLDVGAIINKDGTIDIPEIREEEPDKDEQDEFEDEDDGEGDEAEKFEDEGNELDDNDEGENDVDNEPNKESEEIVDDKEKEKYDDEGTEENENKGSKEEVKHSNFLKTLLILILVLAALSYLINAIIKETSEADLKDKDEVEQEEEQ